MDNNDGGRLYNLQCLHSSKRSDLFERFVRLVFRVVPVSLCNVPRVGGYLSYRYLFCRTGICFAICSFVVVVVDAWMHFFAFVNNICIDSASYNTCYHCALLLCMDKSYHYDYRNTFH